MARTRASVGLRVSSVKSAKARAVAPPPPQKPSVSGNKDWQKTIARFFCQLNKNKEPSVPGPGKILIESDDDEEAMGETQTEEVQRSKDFVCSKINGLKCSVFKDTVTNYLETGDKEKMDETQTANEQESADLDCSIIEDSIELEPLIGDKSHKIHEYFSSQTVKGDPSLCPYLPKKGKGKGKKTKHLDSNADVVGRE